ncbi:MAG: 2-oxoacid:acceptor oxidoreductase family protein [Propionibacteriaceae bacterium]|jgi:pyruvate-ferredoxin/flavodoxin oxidoreductase|nr:2-oxoacid:acceptor oxidoreductase family protein [Propionibacteriaceae bacterium]
MIDKPQYPGIPEVINGNGSVAYVMKQVCGGVIGYPITPSTEIAEIFEAGRAEGQLNVWGKHPFFVEAEGEHSAQSGAMGASLVGGNYVSNASSSHGILYGYESHFVTAGKLIGGFVLQVAARVVTRHSLNVMAGHDDIYALLPTGYTIFFGSDPQEAADLAAIAFRTTSLTLVPSANAMDGFATSHVMSETRLPEPELLRAYLGDPEDRIPCPTVAQEVLFGAKGRVDYLTRWLDKRSPEFAGGNIGAIREFLAANADAIEIDADATLEPSTTPHVPPVLRAAWRRAWKGALQKGTRQRVPSIVDPHNPGLVGGVQNQPDFQAGSADHRTHFLAAVPALARQAMREYADLTGRTYEPVMRYGPHDADFVLIGLGSITDDVRALLPYFERQGLKVAVVSVKLLQPFPAAELVAAVGDAKHITVLERSEDLALTRAVKQSLFEAGQSAHDAQFMTAIFGLGSHDVQPRDLIAIVQAMADGVTTPLVYVGSQFFVKNPATPSLAALQDKLRAAYPETEVMALPTAPNPTDLLPPEALRIRFHSVGGYGTVATGKLLTDMLSSMLGMHSKSSPKYGSEKSGAATNFYLTLSPEPVLFTNAMLEDVEVVISPDHKVFEHDRPLRGLVEGGTFILQTSETPLTVWSLLPAYARQEIRDKHIHFLVVDAFAVAKQHAPTAALETRMMGIAFIGAVIGHVDRIARGGDPEQVKALVREELVKKFGSKGQTVVDANLAVISDAIAATTPVPFDDPEFREAEGVAVKARPALTPRLFPGAGDASSGLFDATYFDDMVARPAREGWLGAAPVLPGTGLFMPNATGAVKNKGLFRREVPVVDLDKCTACLECAIACPDSAIPNQAHEITDLLARAVRSAGLTEEHTAYLLTFVPSWAQETRRTLLEDPKAKDFGAAARAAAVMVPNLADAPLDTILAELAAFPVARIRPVFDQMEKVGAGTGALYSVVIDPWKCTGCLQCVEVCGPGALTVAPQTEALAVQMEAKFARFTELPNTPARFTNGAANPGGDAKRVLMDHDNYYSLTGGHGACRGCGEVTATHLVTALAEATGKTKQTKQIATLESMIYQLTSKLDRAEGERAERITRLIGQLETALWNLEAGPTGRGPASSVIVNSTGCSSVYSSTFPFNPFVTPWLNSLFQDAQASAVGVFEGLFSRYLPEIRARRLAAMELADAYDPVAAKRLETLTWRELTDDELALLPVVLTISGDGAAFDIGFGAISRVLASQTPIKMLVLDTGVYSNTGGQASTASYTGQNSDLARYGKAHPGKREKRKELGLLAALHPDVFVANVSTAMHAHFLAAAARMLAYPDGSGLLQAYTPCGFEQGFGDDLSNARARLAVRSRMAPLFVHDPAAGATLAERLSLEGNPELDAAWATLNLKYVDDDGKTKVMTLPLTPAEFAYGEVRFAKHFHPLADAAPNPTPIAEFVALAHADRAGRTPYIVVADTDSKLTKVAVSSVIVDLVDDRQKNWQLLRYLAGRDADIAAREAAREIAELQAELADAQAGREQSIDDIAHALAGLATAGDPRTVPLPTFGTGAAAGAPRRAAMETTDQVAPLPTSANPPSPVPSALSTTGLGPKPEGVPIWLAEADMPKCTDCATCYQELPALFEQTTIVVDGEARNVSRMIPGALDTVALTPDLQAVIERVKGTCDAEIIQ